MKSHYRSLIFSTLVLATLHGQDGTPVTVDELGFEGIDLGIDLDSPNTTAWVGSRGRKIADGLTVNGMLTDEHTIEDLSFAPEGSNVVKIANDRYLSQNLGITFQPNHRYRITVSIGNVVTPPISGTGTAAGTAAFIGMTTTAPNRNLARLLSSSVTSTDPAVDPGMDTTGIIVSDVVAEDTFQDFTVELTTGDTPPLLGNGNPANIFIFLATDNGGHCYFDNVRFSALDLNAQDSDGDGLPDIWEQENGLNPNDDGSVGESTPGARDGDNGALGDPDGDQLSNLDEFNLRTNPQDDDTDNDGISDPDELRGDGTFDEDTDTDPRVADTDGDRLDDGVEDANRNGVVDAGETNPLNPDTDGDTITDGYEIMVSNSDPLEISDPAIEGNIIGISLQTSRSNDDNSNLEPNVVAGHPDYRQMNWNNFFSPFTSSTTMVAAQNQSEINSPNPMAITDNQGDIQQSMTFEVNGFNLWSANNLLQGSNDRLTKGYWSGNFEMNFTGIPYPNYDLIVYCGAVEARQGTVTVRDSSSNELGVSSYTGNPAIDQITSFDFAISTDTDGTTFPVANVVRFSNLTESEIAIEHDSVGSAGGVFALQVVETQSPPSPSRPELSIVNVDSASNTVMVQAANLTIGTEYHYEILNLGNETFEDLPANGFTAGSASQQTTLSSSLLGDSAIIRISEGAESAP